ncbi:MAG: hypothetical protein KDB14_25235 [Planctomycetales bacterium]|nr:hypothetical protein [Planctomycetales bacterium]
MHARLALALLAAALVVQAPSLACAGNGDEAAMMARFHTTNCRYGDPRKCAEQPRCPCASCQMSWQPIRSMLHPNMLPAGLIRPKPPLNRKIQNLIPKMPAKWLSNCTPWSGCNNENCPAVP